MHRLERRATSAVSPSGRPCAPVDTNAVPEVIVAVTRRPYRRTRTAEQEELWCTLTGVQWIEVFYPSGAGKSLACIYADGTGYECDFMGRDCHALRESPTTPPKNMPDSGGQVGGDQGLGVGQPAEPASPEDAVAPPAKHKKHKHSHGKGRNHA